MIQLLSKYIIYSHLFPKFLHCPKQKFCTHYCTSCNVSKSFVLWQKLEVNFYGWIIFLSPYMPHFVNPVKNTWIALPLDIMNNVTIKVYIQESFGSLFSFLLIIYRGVELLNHVIMWQFFFFFFF